jgi:hypothetical protein
VLFHFWDLQILQGFAYSPFNIEITEFSLGFSFGNSQKVVM